MPLHVLAALITEYLSCGLLDDGILFQTNFYLVDTKLTFMLHLNLCDAYKHLNKNKDYSKYATAKSNKNRLIDLKLTFDGIVLCLFMN